MTDEQYKRVESKLIEFIGRASSPRAKSWEVETLPAAVRALAELQKI